MSESTKRVCEKMAGTSPRLGFLGVGWIGLQRLQAIADRGVAEIAAIADPNPEMSMSAAAVAPDAARMTSMDEILEQRLDGLVIATPSALHAEQAVKALEHGIAVFCQKPLGRTAKETRRVVDAARAANRLLCVDMCYRFTSGMANVREMVRARQLGDVYAVNLIFHNAYGPDKSWFYDPSLSGGGCLLDLGIHLVDLALWVMDSPTLVRLSSSLHEGGKPFSPGAGVEDHAAALLEFDNGATVQLACSWKLQAGQDCVIEASFYGTRGGATFRNVGGSFVDFVAEQFSSTTRKIVSEPPDDWGGRAALAWALRLQENRGFDPAAEQLVEVASILDRIYGRSFSEAKQS